MLTYTNLYKDLPSGEFDRLAPHHIVPRRDNRTAYCFNNGVNICQRARDVLSDAGIDIDEPENGVLLAWPHKRRENGQAYATYDTRFPQAKPHAYQGSEVHSVTSYGAVSDALDEIRQRYPATLSAEQQASLKQEVKASLELIARRMLTNQPTFP